MKRTKIFLVMILSILLLVVLSNYNFAESTTVELINGTIELEEGWGDLLKSDNLFCVAHKQLIRSWNVDGARFS